MTADQHAGQVATWRAERDARLRSPDGWLALVGLHWLAPGENRVGAHPANQVVLHGHEIPPRVGSLWVEGEQVRLVPYPGVAVLHNGMPIGETVLEDDRADDPTVLELGSLRFHLIWRGDRLALRVRDATAPALTRFRGLDHFPIDPSWRLVGRLERAPGDADLEILDVTGSLSRLATPGRVTFDRAGASWGIDALLAGDDGSLWLIFGDATNGSDTYGGGRYLYTEPPLPDGTVVADFNLAFNPPCVFSPFATCPLPLSQNRLPLRIEAGERRYAAPG